MSPLPQTSALHPSPVSSSAKPRTDPAFQRPLPPALSITPVTTSSLPAYRRVITLLLPIHYPDQFYKESVANPTPSSLALCALWHKTPRPGKRKVGSLNNELASSTPGINDLDIKVIGGIQCRLESLLCPPPANSPNSSTAPPPPCQQPHNLYIQTLAILSPYRHLGIATALLDAIICIALNHYPSQNVKEIYAHVWEANEEALEWYVKRGFEVEEKVMEGYYRKLRPSGARVVRRKVGVGDWLRVAEGLKGDMEEGVDGTAMEMEGQLIGKDRLRDG